jgi:DNA-binding CsgD family transcriptional regulator
MKHPGIVAVVKNGLYRAAIKHVVQDFKLHEHLEFRDDLQECLNGVCNPKCLIIDAKSIPEPAKFSFEKIKTKNAKCTILVLNAENLNKSAAPYIHTFLNENDSDAVIQSKFQTFFASIENSEPQDNSHNTISDREKEVLHLVALGKTNKEISEELFISSHTVVTHRKNITSKLGIKTIAGITVYALLNGIIDPDEANK